MGEPRRAAAPRRPSPGAEAGRARSGRGAWPRIQVPRASVSTLAGHTRFQKKGTRIAHNVTRNTRNLFGFTRNSSKILQIISRKCHFLKILAKIRQNCINKKITKFAEKYFWDQRYNKVNKKYN